MSSPHPLLTVTNGRKSFETQRIIQDISFELKSGEIGCLLGPSGCGKTTLLRIIAGFESMDGGEVRIDGQTVSSAEIMCEPENRGIGMVFQDYALFPHLTVFDNIRFGIRKQVGKKQRKTVQRLLAMVGLDGTENTYPHELSGGQQQRVALARALAPEPSLLLLDEPFSNLDTGLRDRLTIEVRDILKHSGITALMVTHNQFEAFSVADRVGVIFNGRLQQWDSGYNIYHNPANLDVATFVGEGAIIEAEVTGPDTINCGLGRLQGQFCAQHSIGETVQLLVRPEDILHRDGSTTVGKILSKSFRGSNILYSLELPSKEVCPTLVSSHHDHKIGQFIGIEPEVDNLVVFPKATTKRGIRDTTISKND